MKVVVALEHRFHRTPDRAVWTQTTFAYSFWQPYLEVFEQVCVVARVCEVHSVPMDWKRADGEEVSFTAIPYYIGPWQYIVKARQVQQVARSAVNSRDAVILRVSSQIANCIEPLLNKTGHPYGVEVVCDPYDVFAPGSVKHPLRPFFRWWIPHQLRGQCAKATAAAYVTKHALQKRYPPGLNTFVTYYSDVELPDAAFTPLPRIPRQGSERLTLINVGTMTQLYKAQNVLIEAVAACVQQGRDIKLVLVGEGKHRPELEAQAEALGLAERINFRGQLPAGDAVRAQLDQADLFVMPSYQEGLPRAMVEAMARALPVIGSTVGGIPELLPPEDMVPSGNVAALANKIREVVTDPQRMARMSIHNLAKAKEYTQTKLHKQRIEFYRYVREKTEAWLVTQKPQQERESWRL